MSTPDNVKAYSEMTITERMRNNLRPQGTEPIVGLRTRGAGIWLDHEFVTKCIDELDKMQARAIVGDEPTNLEKLAYMLLCDSAYIETK